ncbi:hypothetical protein BO83DRAFT_75540 [Aspergillus eucalypticola CBS 122712]|uniref:Uncharacterized protein n=1 Tax=Aspergillus eucalypticola (strain CBS 122712 / IBT 29274) TaxID=1448314 RepID=A0A317V7Q3_ASPEC|nr:uncharacterized protein BO83DRAFT_75540 [Aspergillus eucalypticola CBS 122712]PWY68872.1 hypothetical protein BO83DRAFT_75540 [Aspergillus eucalypticola CBS 122712]
MGILRGEAVFLARVFYLFCPRCYLSGLTYFLCLVVVISLCRNLSVLLRLPLVHPPV